MNIIGYIICTILYMITVNIPILTTIYIINILNIQPRCEVVTRIMSRVVS